MLHVINTNNLIDPADEGRHFDVDAGYLSPAAAETPADQTTQFVIAFVLAHQRASAVTLTIATHDRLVKLYRSMDKFVSIYLTGVVAGLATGTETGRWHNEDLLGHSVDLSDTLAFTHNRHFGFSYSQRDWSG